MLITGASGQDGLILATVLARRGHAVYATASHRWTISDLTFLVPSVSWAISTEDGFVDYEEFAPDAEVVIDLAAHSSVAKSWIEPLRVIKNNLDLQIRALEFAASCKAKIVLSGSSEMYARGEGPVDEESELRPASPYGISKASGVETLRLLRGRGDLFGTALTMFNHESPLRNPSFVTGKIAEQLRQVYEGQRRSIQLGSITTKKDFSWAPDFVRVLASPLTWDSNQDYVLASGELTSIETLAKTGLEHLGLDCEILEEPNFAWSAEKHPFGVPAKAARQLDFVSRTAPSGIIPKMVEMLANTRKLPPIFALRSLIGSLADEVELETKC